MATLGNWSFADLTGNSQFVLVGSILYAVGNTTTGGQFAIYKSTDYGITANNIASYTFPGPPYNVEFDPAIFADAFGVIHILGTRHNPNTINPSLPGSNDVVKFTFDTNTNILSGPFTIVQGSQGVGQPAVLIGSDYDITTLPAIPGSPPTSGGTIAVVQIVDQATYQEQVVSYEINTSNVVVGSQILASSPARGGQAYDSVSLVSTASTIEAYVTSHNKVIPLGNDITFTLGLFKLALPLVSSPPSAWSAQTVLLTLPVRNVDNRLTVIANGNKRWLSDTLYTQNRSGLSGNMLLGYLNDITSIVPWSFNQFPGTPTASLVESSINVFADNSTMLGLITRDLSQNPSVDGIVSVNTLNVANWQYAPNPAFHNPVVAASWLRGTKSVLPVIAEWGFIGQSRVGGLSTFYSGYLVPPVAAITPTAINPALRNQSYTLDASASFDLNYNTIEFEWNLQISTGVPFPSWQAIHAYVTGNKIVDANGNVQVCVLAGASGATQPLAQWEPNTVYALNAQIVDSNGSVQQVTTAGTSGSLVPFWNSNISGTTGDGTVVWTNEGTANDVWSTTINGLTGDGSAVWALALTLVPNYVPNTQHTTAVLTIGDVIGPAAYTFQVQVGVIDLDSSNNPIHTPPTGTQLAQANTSLPFVPLTTIQWLGNFAGAPTWLSSTSYPQGSVIYDGLYMEEATTGGISAPIFPPHFAAIVSTTLNTGGSGYAVNDTGTIGNGGAFYRVLSIGGGGSVATYSVTSAGQLYTISNNVPTSPDGIQAGVGVGFTVNITAITATTPDGTVTWTNKGIPNGGSPGSPPIPASVNVGRNASYTLTPTITPGQAGLPITYSWTQLSGTPVPIISDTVSPTLVINTEGANLNTPLVDGLVFQITVNDSVNIPVSSTVTLNVLPYIFNETDSHYLARSNWAVVADYIAEAHVIPTTSGSPPMPGPYTVTVNHPPAAHQTFVNGGVKYTGLGSLLAVITPPLVGQYNVYPTGQYWFNAGDAARAIQITYAITQQATIAQRNTPQFWPPLDVSGMLTDQTNFKRSTNLEGDGRFIVISPASVLVFGIEINPSGSYLLRKLLVPDGDLGVIEDAVHTEMDYTIVLTSTNTLYRYTVAPLMNDDSPDTTINLNNYVTLTPPIPGTWVTNIAYTLGDEVLDTNGNVQIVTQNGISAATQPTWNPTREGITNDGPFLLWKNLGKPVVFNAIFSTDTFADSRVIALSGPSGCFLMQLNSTLFTVEGFFEISVESGLVYGADNVQWIRQSNVESLHSGKVLLGTLDSQGRTYETLIDLNKRLVLGTWDASKLKNQYVTTGEILFEPQSTYVGLPIAPVMQTAVVNPNASVTITWIAERPDLITNYQVQMSVDGGPYNLLAYIGSGIVQTYTTSPQVAEHTYAFEVRSGSADGFSPYSLPINAYVGTPQSPVLNQIITVTGPVTGPFVATLTWMQNNPNANAVSSYIVQKSVDAGAFSTIATVIGGTNQSYQDGPLAAGHVYTYQVATVYNGVTTPYSEPISIVFPTGAEVAVPGPLSTPPNNVLPAGTHGVVYPQAVLYAGYFVTLPSGDTDLVSYGVGPYTWALVGGSLPPGIALDTTSGALSGTPTTPGTYTFSVTAMDSALPTTYTSAPSPTLTIVIS